MFSKLMYLFNTFKYSN